jgi:hypothetical protein
VNRVVVIMGILVNCDTQRSVFLRVEHAFGRSRTADTLVDSPDASRLHASVRWTGFEWELRDHSRNGTRLDGQRLSSEQAQALRVGQTLAFGHHPSSQWLVQSVAPPSAVLWPLHDGGAVIHLSHSNHLPHGDAPLAHVYLSDEHEWCCTQAGQTRQLQDGDEVFLGEFAWCFVSGAALHATLGAVLTPEFCRNETQMQFTVSLDEEHVNLQVVGTERTVNLGERTHHYCLLTLARLRLADAQRNIDSAAQGWVEIERLAKMLGVDVPHLNIQIHRARKQLAQALPGNEALCDIVERRRGAIRFSSVGIRVVRGSVLEGGFDPPNWVSSLPPLLVA